MDFSSLLLELHTEKAKLETIIAALEELQQSYSSHAHLHPARKRRGRKFMGTEERQQVSERMKRYWAGRKKHKRERVEQP